MRLAQHVRRHAVQRHSLLAFTSPALRSSLVARQSSGAHTLATNNAMLSATAAAAATSARKATAHYCVQQAATISTAIDSSIEDFVETLFSVPESKRKLHISWKERLLRLERPTSRHLIRQLTPYNSLGFDSGKELTKKGTLLEYAMQQKAMHPEKVALIRVGEFYETYGVDALMLVEYAGLNPMGQKAKAGCPARNIQATLDGLTSAGLSVCVYEELNDVDSQRGPSSKRIKRRALTQIVSPGASTYMYDLCLRAEDIDFRENRPYIGVMRTANGYAMCEIYADEKVMIVNERMTEEALRATLETVGCVEPMYLQDVDDLHFLPDHCERLTGYKIDDFFAQVLRNVGRTLECNVSDFRVVRPTREARPRPLYASTALQIGLIANANVPDLISTLLPRSYSAHSARFLRRWLLNPPPHHIADHMQTLCRSLSKLEAALPPCSPVPVGKVVSLISAKQSNVPLFRDIAGNIEGMLVVLGANSPAAGNPYEPILSPLLALTAYQSGIDMDREQLCSQAEIVLKHVKSVVAFAEQEELDVPFSDPHGMIPAAFFERNEDEFRGNVLRDSPEVQAAYGQVELAARALCDQVKADFPPECEIVHDLVNNAIMLKKRPSSRDGYVAPMDRNRKPIAKRYTTPAVEAALSNYWDAVANATDVVKATLQDLSNTLYQHLPAIVQASHWAVVIQAAAQHTAASLQRGWVLPTLVNAKENALTVKDLRPYWMGSEATPNSFTLRGLFLLTAPNMSGKSTLMRAATVAALLANCGLFVPCSEAQVPRYDNFFLRTASYDIPSEGKSAFALEMDDVRVMLRDCTSKSLVMIDELGKGTSARDGSGLSGALLEALDEMAVTGIFATHLHELFQLPLNLSRVSNKRMGLQFDERNVPRWTYTIEDGTCTDSLALHTARLHGISPTIINRAEQLVELFDQHCRPADAAPASSKRGKGAKRQGEQQAGDAPATAGAGEIVRSAGSSYELNDLRETVAAVSGAEKVVLVEQGYEPPVSLEGKACVYVLHLVSRGRPDELYIGETESIRQRLQQHRAVRKGVKIRALVAPAPNKSAARSLETRLINEFKRLGYDIQQDKDQHHQLFAA